MTYLNEIEACVADWDTLAHLYQECAASNDWPTEIQNLAQLRAWFESWGTTEWTNRGELRVIYDLTHLQSMGFYTLCEVNPSFCPDAVKVLEGGTFLIPALRGTEINAWVKAYQARRARDTYHAGFIVYTILPDNARALRAMRKFPFIEVYDEAVSGPWRRLLRRKRFETGVDTVHLFVHPIR